MPSFDISSELNEQELKNALDQVAREIKQRYDFKGSMAAVTEEEEGLVFVAEDDFKLKALQDVFQTKAMKRGLDLRSFVFEDAKAAGGSTVRCVAKLVQGIEQEKAKDLIKKIKELKLKIQAQIQEDKVRVTGNKRDDLQSAIAAIKALNFEIPLQFGNFRE